ncbi:MAG: DNA recombination protein RmuC [Bacteroidales bacterium]|nr:DNA recombination protein RmuC [Bacteroidales bacterium]
MNPLYLLIPFVVGGGVFYFISRYLSQKNISELKEKQSKLENENIIKLSEADKEKSLFQERLSALQQENNSLEDKLKTQISKSEDLATGLAVAETDKKYLKEKLETQVKELEDMQKKLTMEFENIANKILKSNTMEFTRLSQKNVGDILNPLKEKIKSFEDTVRETSIQEAKDNTSLMNELKSLRELNAQISEDASNLTNALKSDSKKQGNWGEIILERVLERSGLNKGEEYDIQESLRSEAGELLRPDVIIKLPDNKHIIVDSKVSLTAYEAFVNSELPEDKEKFLKQHIESVKNHVKGLGDKNYQNSPNIDSPDFVLLFIPIESSFSVVVKADIELFNYAWSKNIVIVSPTTMLATLRTIASLWKQEKQTRNALEIADQSGKLYDKFVSFLVDLEKMGNQMNTLKNTYDDAHNKLKSGKGNIIGKVKQLKKMGAKASKEIPAKYIIEDNLLNDIEE